MPITLANTINGNGILAARAIADASGNNIASTYATQASVSAIRQVPDVGSGDDGKVLTVLDNEGTVGWSQPESVQEPLHTTDSIVVPQVGSGYPNVRLEKNNITETYTESGLEIGSGEHALWNGEQASYGSTNVLCYSGLNLIPNVTTEFNLTDDGNYFQGVYLYFVQGTPSSLGNAVAKSSTDYAPYSDTISAVIDFSSLVSERGTFDQTQPFMVSVMESWVDTTNFNISDYLNNSILGSSVYGDINQGTSYVIEPGLKVNVPQVKTMMNLATVASSGSYNDLSNKPTIPTVPDTKPVVAGANVTITEGANDITIAATDTTYTAGNMIAINTANSNAIGVSTTAGITDIQRVNSLPASPVSTVLYLIPET